MKHLSNDHKDHSDQHENSQKLCDETGHPILNLLESEQKLNNNMLRIFQWRKAIVEQILAAEEINKSKRAGL